MKKLIAISVLAMAFLTVSAENYEPPKFEAAPDISVTESIVLVPAANVETYIASDYGQTAPSMYLSAVPGTFLTVATPPLQVQKTLTLSASLLTGKMVVLPRCTVRYATYKDYFTPPNFASHNMMKHRWLDQNRPNSHTIIRQ